MSLILFVSILFVAIESCQQQGGSCVGCSYVQEYDYTIDEFPDSSTSIKTDDLELITEGRSGKVRFEMDFVDSRAEMLVKTNRNGTVLQEVTNNAPDEQDIVIFELHKKGWIKSIRGDPFTSNVLELKNPTKGSKKLVKLSAVSEFSGAICDKKNHHVAIKSITSYNQIGKEDLNCKRFDFAPENITGCQLFSIEMESWPEVENCSTVWRCYRKRIQKFYRFNQDPDFSFDLEDVEAMMKKEIEQLNGELNKQ